MIHKKVSKRMHKKAALMTYKESNYHSEYIKDMHSFYILCLIRGDYVAEMSCSQLLLIKSATYYAHQDHFAVINNVAMSLYDIM